MDDLKTIEWLDGKVRILDQTQLPNELVALDISDYIGVLNAINTLSVRGAPAIGIAAAYGVVLSVWYVDNNDRTLFLQKANESIEAFKNSRPTAKNLFWAVDRMRTVLTNNLNKPLPDIKNLLLKEAQFIHNDDVERCKKIGEFGADLLPHRVNILTHCNAGALATGGYGTALGVVRSAVFHKRIVKVFANETRPLLQGSRLTAFELLEDDIDVTVITDNMTAYVMQKGMINAVIVGADRIALNGDVANKIGTYGVAVLAKQHKVPFYVAAPLSTFDPEIKTGEEIPIEERDPDEVRKFGDYYSAPDWVRVLNPAFDVTPANLISAIITEKGVIHSPDTERIADYVK